MENGANEPCHPRHRSNLGEFNADTFFKDCHKTLKADYILANPPFNLSDWGADKLKDDPRWNMAYHRQVTPTLPGCST